MRVWLTEDWWSLSFWLRALVVWGSFWSRLSITLPFSERADGGAARRVDGAPWRPYL
ncbi:MAG: hypothetical protein ACP5OU_09335 [Methanothrix sp.]